jgi:hypothetical protein
MIKELFKFIFFIVPEFLLQGLMLILFENKNILAVIFKCRKRKKAQTKNEIERKALNNYLNKLLKKGDQSNEKKTDK